VTQPKARYCPSCGRPLALSRIMARVANAIRAGFEAAITESKPDRQPERKLIIEYGLTIRVLDAMASELRKQGL
jgi:hypothetical protein